ncbi:MAG TPA: methyl-accepting chemotaxis protein [Casimicrobiaceae bacterium]|nr:methyl-accepting chemotaxis protein [Casimicrobiaceae bacterium]
MALKMPKLAGNKSAMAAGDTNIEIPTTQVKMTQQASAVTYDPLASVSIMEQLRTANAQAKMPHKLPLIGRLAVVKQFKVLGFLIVTFAILAAFILFIDGRMATQQAAASTTALDMQMLSQRIARAAASAAQAQPGSIAILKDARDRLKFDIETLKNGGTIRGVSIDATQDADAAKQLDTITKMFEQVSGAADTVIAAEPAIAQAVKDAAPVPDLVQKAVRMINTDADPLLAASTELATAYEGSGRAHAVSMWLAGLFALLALGCLVLLGKVFLDDARVRAFDSEGENKRNQEAILRLLNEMGNLADGDLTVQASVTEDVTGAIADSINFTIEELRTLVKGINSATDQVNKATQETQAISNRLFEASQRQNKEIQNASASVLTMAQSISEVAQNAAQSARVAQTQLAAAEKGGNAVQNQIAGMNEIRTQIQETSKRIKRLGESSLEIGEIVELISDITEQTNVLALNAAIQAASAGEAGRGFTVVAEEVQRLAERSAEATKQIEAIVKTIQADTQDAVAAMDRSTVGVVEGAKLSDAAGQALTEIQRVSRELAELIGRISAQTQTQSSSVADVTRGMQGILKITEETTEGTKQTNVSISQLTKLAAELRSSVAGFKV